MSKVGSISEMLKHCDNTELYQFIIDYYESDQEFRKSFNNRFNPERKITGDKKIYAGEVAAAFLNNPGRPGNRYNNWNDYGFCAEDVAADLQDLLDKARFFMEAGNVDETVLMCQAMIETIPDEWDPNFDHDGDVQVKYDGAIDLLQEMMDQNKVSLPQKEQLFRWYTVEYKNQKHDHVGLNTSLGSLEDYFTDTPEMTKVILSNIDEKINNTVSDYERENAILNKIGVLKKIKSGAEAEALIEQYIHIGRIRELRLETLVHQKEYAPAIILIK